jgi:PII-like signaling protein
MAELRLHFGERDRDGDGPLEAAVIEACARREVAAALTLRGVEGFGAKQRLRTDRLLSLSEDAPLVVVAVGGTEVIETLAAEVREMAGEGLLAIAPLGAGEGRVRATIWGPRGGPASPHLGAVAALRKHGADAATVLLGVDGVLGGERRRARFLAANQGVPAITVAVGERTAIDAALADLATLPSLVTCGSVATSSRIPI